MLRPKIGIYVQILALLCVTTGFKWDCLPDNESVAFCQYRHLAHWLELIEINLETTKEEARMAIPIYIFITIFGLGFSWLIGMNGQHIGGVPLSFVCGLIAYGVNWLVCIPSWAARTEKYFDLTGSLTYFSVTLFALVLSGNFALPNLVVAAMVCIWCGRLGSMLFARIKRDGEDKRFRAIKKSLVRFVGVWTIQGLWVVLTMGCALVILTNTESLSFGPLFLVGAGMWVVGFVIEVIADNQKNAFKADPDNKGKFINVGLWTWSQHPNYFGEMLLWTGVAVIALPILSGWTWVALISPVFVFLLLTKVSGIPMLDRMAQERWGEDAAYQTYKKNTSKLFPLPPRAS